MKTRFWAGRVVFGLMGGLCVASAVAETPYLPEKIPGETIANTDTRFLKRFHGLLLDYSQRAHQCSRPLVMDTQIVQFSSLDRSAEPPVLSGPIHEQWKVTACGKKFLFYLGVAPSEQDEREVVVATVSKVVDW